MNEKLITALLAILLALGGWTLSRTFSLSTDMVLIKEKVSSLEEKLMESLKRKRRRKTNKAYVWFLKKRRWYRKKR